MPGKVHAIWMDNNVEHIYCDPYDIESHVLETALIAMRDAPNNYLYVAHCTENEHCPYCR